MHASCSLFFSHIISVNCFCFYFYRWESFHIFNHFIRPSGRATECEKEKKKRAERNINRNDMKSLEATFSYLQKFQWTFSRSLIKNWTTFCSHSRFLCLYLYIAWHCFHFSALSWIVQIYLFIHSLVCWYNILNILIELHSSCIVLYSSTSHGKQWQNSII